MISILWKNLKPVLYLFVLTVLISCNQEKDKDWLDIKNYLENDLKHKTQEESVLYLFLPLDACANYLNVTKDFLLKQDQNKTINIILIGKTHKEVDRFANGLDEKFTIVKDYKNIGRTMPALVDMPLLISFSKGKINKLAFNAREGFNEMKEIVISFNE